jgi:NADPH-dependent 2,4-dienoyl-CoA reductase/sulfur reductase-like enzyme
LLTLRKTNDIMKTGRIVILGNGGAAVHAARAARDSGYAGEIHVVSDTNIPAFNPMLSPYYLKGVISWEDCFPFGRSFYAEYDITCHFDVTVESLDPINQEIKLAKGTRLPYDRCLVATGASPVIPPISGLKDSPRAYPLRTAVSVKNLESAIPSAKKVIVLGASLVGLKVAEVLSKRAVKVILLDVVDQMLPRGAHALSAEYLKAYFEEHGTDVRLGCAMEGMEGAPEGVTCHFPDDIIEEADFVAVCTGVRPNIDFIDSDQVDIKQAILIDQHMRTNSQNLFAAGDVSQGYNLFSGKQECLGTWGNACHQGRIAGCNMAGEEVAFAGSMPQNISPFFDWTYAQLGDMQPQGEDIRYVAFGAPRDGGYIVLAFDQEQLTGVNLINCTHLAGRFRRAITQRWGWRRYLEDPKQYFTVQGIEGILNEAACDLCYVPHALSKRPTLRSLCMDD